MIWQSEGSRMRDLFVEDGIETSRAQQLSPDAAHEIRDAIVGRHVCPFCGAVREQNDGVCSRCTMDNTSASRQATKARIGPWYVFQSRNPAAPGMKFETLLGFIHKGRVKARSVVRGPTTHQLWRFAAHVKGISREFGICYSCGGAIARTAGLCPHCNRLQEPPADPDVFIEGQQSFAPAAVPEPVVRNLAPTPLAAGDIVVPPLTAAHPVVHRPNDPLNAAAPAQNSVPESEDTRAKRAEGFLSPQDLAAAFNLDFRPKGGPARKQQQQSTARRPSIKSRPPRWGRRFLVLVFLAAIGGTAYALATKPVLRAQALDYSRQAIDWTKQKYAELHERMAAKPPRSTSTTPNAGLPADPLDTTAAIPATPRTHAPVSESNGATVPAPQTPATSPAAAPTSSPSPWDQLYGKPKQTKSDISGQKQSVSTATPPPTPPPDASPPPVSSRVKRPGTLDEMRTLYRQAIDAEGDNDFATAVKKYEQIKEFTPDLWPADLNLRLTQARRQVQ
jgi:hypothetical protein